MMLETKLMDVNEASYSFELINISLNFGMTYVL